VAFHNHIRTQTKEVTFDLILITKGKKVNFQFSTMEI